MRKTFPRIASMVLALMLCFCSVLVIPVQASISISGGSGGITIKPGTAPDMTDVGDAFDTVSGKLVPSRYLTWSAAGSLWSSPSTK